jgi:hypothetical protein
MEDAAARVVDEHNRKRRVLRPVLQQKQAVGVMQE